MRIRRWLPYFGVVVPWVIVGIPAGLVIPILILDIPILDVPLYHKVVDIVVLLIVSLLLGAVFMAIDAKLGYVNALREHRGQQMEMVAEEDILISEVIRPAVSSELLAFVRNVLASEGLTHWPVHIWSCKGEGICGDTICFGLCETERQTKALFLHEIAHALLNPKRSCHEKDWHKDSYWHKDAWQGEFRRLCKTYSISLRPIDAVTHYLSEEVHES